MTRRLTLEQVIEKSNIIHNNKYDYSKVNYTNAHTDVIINCNIHGEFIQNINNHLYNKRGCQQCSFDEMSRQHLSNTEEFIKKSILTHGNKYDYSKSIYTTAIDRIEIICKIHGSFWQKAIKHLAGCGCPKCRICGKETKWLDSLNIPNDNAHRQVRFEVNNTFIVVDGFVNKTNSIYEFYGDFWHGNPKRFQPNDINYINKKTFGELYLKTLQREDLIKSHGYNLIVMWESDFT